MNEAISKHYVSRFTVLGLRFIRKPASEPPLDGKVVMADNGVGGGWTDRQAAIFKDGEWLPFKSKRLRFEPMYWVTLDPQQ